MATDKSFHLGLLYLTHLLINADGIVNEEEQRALQKLREKEKIPPDVFKEFLEDVKTKTTKTIYNDGVALLNECDDSKKLNALAHMYKLTEIDGSVHVKEVRLLLYSIKMAAVEFNDVVIAANKIRY
ncbi:MAG TPA: TerB family tellurite resistance protein [Cyclobacteriaceae bacterium]|jgi:uncharacterized tellurite resistance protein B-like protein|nr:TerB family tellurite resistance protein [Cyclobacteriaceae bacterium]